MPQIRVLVIGDDLAAGGTQAFPWVMAARVEYECWSIVWGDHGSRLGGNGGLQIPVESMAADIAAADPDVIIVSGRLFDSGLESARYAEVVGLWLDAIATAARAEAVKIALPPITPEGGRNADRLARIIEKTARQRDFFFVRAQDWIADADDAAMLFPGGDMGATPEGHDYLGTRLADELRKLDVGLKAKVAVMRRQQSSRNGNLAAGD